MRTTLDLPDPLFRELKARAARENLKLKELIAKYVEAGLSGRLLPDPAGQIRRSPLPPPRPAEGKPIPSLSNKAIAGLLDDTDSGNR